MALGPPNGRWHRPLCGLSVMPVPGGHSSEGLGRRSHATTNRLLRVAVLVPVVPRTDFGSVFVPTVSSELAARMEVLPLAVLLAVDVHPFRDDRSALGICHEATMAQPTRSVWTKDSRISIANGARLIRDLSDVQGRIHCCAAVVWVNIRCSLAGARMR